MRFKKNAEFSCRRLCMTLLRQAPFKLELPEFRTRDFGVNLARNQSPKISALFLVKLTLSLPSVQNSVYQFEVDISPCDFPFETISGIRRMVLPYCHCSVASISNASGSPTCVQPFTQHLHSWFSHASQMQTSRFNPLLILTSPQTVSRCSMWSGVISGKCRVKVVSPSG